jgi:hypothetical protein
MTVRSLGCEFGATLEWRPSTTPTWRWQTFQTCGRITWRPPPRWPLEVVAGVIGHRKFRKPKRLGADAVIGVDIDHECGDRTVAWSKPRKRQRLER